MSKIIIYVLKSIRKIHQSVFKTPAKTIECEMDSNVASDILFDMLTANKSSMVARFGSTEMSCLMNYIGITRQKKQYLNYILNKSNPWWWESNIINQMQQWSGFFPPTSEKIEQFCRLILDDMKEVDVLGSWLSTEEYFEQELIGVKKIWLLNLEPFWSIRPWTKALEGKNVLVVHPFEKTIKSQYLKRKLLFKNEDILPDFNLITVKAVQTIAGEKSDFSDWFEALEYMKSEIDKHDYDVCLIGAGAYGFPLAAHVKRKGKKAIHIGGSLQLLFGIRGKRWETGLYKTNYNYGELINDYWVRADDTEKPHKAKTVEDSCYW